jgi:hypothetical protein
MSNRILVDTDFWVATRFPRRDNGIPWRTVLAAEVLSQS